MNRKVFGYALAAALSLGTVGGTLAYATGLDEGAVAEVPAAGQEDCGGMENLDEATKSKIEEIKSKVESELEALGVTLPDKGAKRDAFANLDEETKAKAEAVIKKVKEDTLTREEAETQLEALGVSLPEKHGHDDFLADLDAETKAKAEAVLDQVKAGTLSREQAKTQLEALGVTLPKKHNPFAGLDEATKEKAQAILDQAEAQLEELGVATHLFGSRHRQGH